MKTLLALTLCLGSFGALADHHMEGKGKEGRTFEEKKSLMSEHLDKRISHLNEMKSCVSSAKDEAGLKSCKEKMREHRKEMSDMWKEKRQNKKK